MKRSRKNLGNQYADALEKAQAAERKFRRAFKAWERATADVRRLERKLDALDGVKIPGGEL